MRKLLFITMTTLLVVSCTKNDKLIRQFSNRIGKQPTVEIVYSQDFGKHEIQKMYTWTDVRITEKKELKTIIEKITDSTSKQGLYSFSAYGTYFGDKYKEYKYDNEFYDITEMKVKLIYLYKENIIVDDFMDVKLEVTTWN